jgi:hypothetical protein
MNKPQDLHRRDRTAYASASVRAGLAFRKGDDVAAVSGEVPTEPCDPLRERLADLRRLLADKFPEAPQRNGGTLPTGLADVDAVEGGLRRAAITELAGASGAGALFLHAMLRALSRERCFGALVDAGRSFDPDSGSQPALARLLVVFCSDATQAVKATDLLLRDGNLSLVLLDLQAAQLREIQRVPANAWHRLQRLAEQTTAAVVVLTPQPLVEAAHVRIAATTRWPLSAQRLWRNDLIAETAWRVFPRRTFNRHADAEEETGVHATA